MRTWVAGRTLRLVAASATNDETTGEKRVQTLTRPMYHLIVAATLIAATGVFLPQTAAASTSYHVRVVFNQAQFTRIDDGFYNDTAIEVYGSMGAYTSAGAASAGGLPYRNFATWGHNPSGCPSGGVPWDGLLDAPCFKSTFWDGIVGHWTTENLNNLWLCPGADSTSCVATYSKNNNAIDLTVHPGETIKVAVHMKDYDSASSDDEVCTGSKTYGPFTDAQLQSISFGDSIHMPDNGNAECIVGFSVF